MGAYATIISDRSLFARLAPTNRTIEPLNVHPDSRDLCGVISQMISSYWLSGCSWLWHLEWKVLSPSSDGETSAEHDVRWGMDVDGTETFTIDHLERAGRKTRQQKFIKSR